MPRTLLLQSPKGKSSLVEALAPDEKTLHDCLMSTPDLLPVADMGLDGPLLVVGRETSLASGRVDLVLLAPSGDVLLVELKTGPQNGDFRSALAQILDYGSDLWRMTPEQFDNAVVQRYLASSHAPQTAAKDLTGAATARWPARDGDPTSSWRDRLTRVLDTGDFHFVVVAQTFTPTMDSTVRYLNATRERGHFHLVQLVRFADPTDPTAPVAFVGQTVAGPDPRTPKVTSSADEDSFLAGLTDDDYRYALNRIFDAARAQGLTFAWGSKGASLRVKVPDRVEPVSVAWIFPEGRHWYGLRHLTLGIDPATAATVPESTQALLAYADLVERLPGGQPTPSKSLRARTFTPADVAHEEKSITDALAQCVALLTDRPESDQR